MNYVVKFFILLYFVSTFFVASYSNDNLLKNNFENFLLDLKKFQIPEDQNKITQKDLENNKTLAKKIFEFIDLTTISKRALGNDVWGKIGPEKQKVFVTTLKRLISLNAFPRSNRFLNKVEFKNENPKIANNKATIKQKIIIKGDETHPEDSVMLVEYFFEKSNNKWYLIDLAFDNVSTLDNFKNQFASIINREKDIITGYNKLYDLMLTKKKELEDEFGKVIPNI